MRNSMVSRPSAPSSCKALTRELIFTKTRNDNLNGIKNLNLWGNDLEDLSLLKEMPNLQVISLSVNNIKTLKYFENCLKLQELYLRKNNIQLLNEIEYLINLPELKVLWLCDNPCANVKNYRQVIIKNLPFLTKLDNDVITPGEREKYYQGDAIDRFQNNIHEISNHKVMPNENNYQSVKPKTNNYLNELEQNQSRFQPNQKNFSNRKATERRESSPLKPSNRAKKVISYKQENYSSNNSNLYGYQGNQPLKSDQKLTSNIESRTSTEIVQNNLSHGIKNQNQIKILQGNIDDMVQNGSKSSANPVNRFYEINEYQQNEFYSINPQLIKQSSLINNPSSISVQQKICSQNVQSEGYSSVQKQPKIFPKKETNENEYQQTKFTHKGSSPNIIMAIMSLLDDLDTDGLEIIKRETERKLIEKRHEEKVYQLSAVKNYKRA